MLKTATKTEARDAQQELTDGFHLIIDALKLNGLNTIYGVPGIPVTDFGRMAQAEGIRLISFRHEQNAGNAAAIAGFLTKKPGVCLTVSAPGFLHGLTVLANATTNCFPMIIISGLLPDTHPQSTTPRQGPRQTLPSLPLCFLQEQIRYGARR
jgi:oxalyl-CoA decarboxylase